MQTVRVSSFALLALGLTALAACSGGPPALNTSQIASAQTACPQQGMLGTARVVSAMPMAGGGFIVDPAQTAKQLLDASGCFTQVKSAVSPMMTAAMGLPAGMGGTADYTFVVARDYNVAQPSNSGSGVFAMAQLLLPPLGFIPNEQKTVAKIDVTVMPGEMTYSRTANGTHSVSVQSNFAGPQDPSSGAVLEATTQAMNDALRDLANRRPVRSAPHPSRGKVVAQAGKPAG